jgi:hypothetical protein
MPFGGPALVYPKIIQCLLDFGMNATKIRSFHVATLKEIYQIRHELGAEIVFRHMALN